jgi:hypothetical protein
MLKKILIILLILNIYPNEQDYRASGRSTFGKLFWLGLALKNAHSGYSIAKHFFNKAGESAQEINDLRKILTQMGIIVQKNNKGYDIDIPSYLSQQEVKEARVICALLIEEDEKREKNIFFGLLGGLLGVVGWVCCVSETGEN